MLTTEYYLSYDLDNNELMFFKNINEIIAPASLTKLMTALVLIDNYNLSDYIVISLPENYVFEGKVAYLEPGQEMTVENLLEFILIYSANDACFAASELVTTGNDNFVDLMNKKANQLGMNSTNFMNPDGLDQEGHYTTLSDLLILSKEIIKNYELMTILMRPSFISNIEGVDKLYLNTNKLIDRNFYGLKTGWTNDAGLTFIGHNQSNDRNILTIVNKSFVNESKDNHFLDTRKLYKSSVDTYLNNLIFETNENLYRVRSSRGVFSVNTNEPWYVFGNKILIDKILTKEIKQNKYSLSVNEEIYNIQIGESDHSVNWSFKLRRMITRNANNIP